MIVDLVEWVEASSPTKPAQPVHYVARFSPQCK
jgi:hypothetical protein